MQLLPSVLSSNSSPGPSSSAPTSQGVQAPKTGISLSSGWYMSGGILGAILLSSTPVAPLAAGILTIALIYQLGALVQGK